jgi:hypothetical protein
MPDQTQNDQTPSQDRPMTDATAAVDRLLAKTRPAHDAAREAALLDRIVAAAERTPRVIAATPAPSPARLHAQPPTPPPRSQPRPTLRSNRDWWGGAGILAASLLIGVIAGQTAYSEQSVRGFEAATGMTLASATTDLADTLASAEPAEDD